MDGTRSVEKRYAIRFEALVAMVRRSGGEERTALAFRVNKILPYILVIIS